MAAADRPRRKWELLDVYTRDVTGRDLTRLFTRDARDAYRAFSGTLDRDALAKLRLPRRIIVEIRAFLMAFGLKLSPARRLIFGLALVMAVLGVMQYAAIPPVETAHGNPISLRSFWLLMGSVLALVLLVVLEVADRLSLKNDLEVARNIQLAMLPSGPVPVPGVSVFGLSRPANTVGGDFYDIRPLSNGRLLIAVGDVAGKGSPAALLMALFLAMERVLLDELTDLVPLTTRLNAQIVRQAPGTRFITLFIASYDPATGSLDYVNAGHPPALIRRADGRFDRLQTGGVALGLFEGSEYTLGTDQLAPGELVATYSDGITEAEHPRDGFFEETGLQRVLAEAGQQSAEAMCRTVFRAVAVHTEEGRLSDDLTVLVLERTTT